MDPIKILFFALVILTALEFSYLRPRKRRHSRRSAADSQITFGDRLHSFLYSGKVLIAVFLMAFIYVLADGYYDNYKRSLEIGDAVRWASAPAERHGDPAASAMDQNTDQKLWTAFVQEVDEARDQMPAEQFCQYLKNQMGKLGSFSKRSLEHQDQMAYLSQSWVRDCEG